MTTPKQIFYFHKELYPHAIATCFTITDKCNFLLNTPSNHFVMCGSDYYSVASLRKVRNSRSRPRAAQGCRRSSDTLLAPSKDLSMDNCQKTDRHSTVPDASLPCTAQNGRTQDKEREVTKGTKDVYAFKQKPLLGLHMEEPSNFVEYFAPPMSL